MGTKEDLAPLIDEVIQGMTSNEFTTYDFMMAFARNQEKPYVKALHENLEHAAGPFGALKEVMESLLDGSEKASKVREGARAIDMFGLPSTTTLWQRKTAAK